MLTLIQPAGSKTVNIVVLGLNSYTPCIIQVPYCTKVFLPLWSSWQGRSGRRPRPRHTGVGGPGTGRRAAEPELHPAFPDTHCWVTSGHSARLWREKNEGLTWTCWNGVTLDKSTTLGNYCNQLCTGSDRATLPAISGVRLHGKLGSLSTL